MSTYFFVYLVLMSVALPVFAYIMLGRRLRRSVPDPARRGRAWGRKLEVQRGDGLWNHVIFYTVVILAGLVILRLTLGNRLAIPISIWGTLIMVGLMIVLVYAHIIMGNVREKRFFGRLRQEDYLICPDCHYSLSGHAQGGRCSECGYEFTRESIVKDWIDVMKMARRWREKS